MKRRLIALLGLLSIASTPLLSGCASTHESSDAGRLPFTQTLKARYALGPGEIAGLQFWVSDDIYLRRVTADGDRRIENGRIVERTGQDVNDIVIYADTPGIAVGSGADWVAVSFDPGSYLYFSSTVDGLHVTGVSPDGRHYLWADSWAGRGIVNVNGVPYEAAPGNNLAHLLVGLKQVNTVRAREQVLDGRVINRR